MTYKLVYLARRAGTVSREDWPRTWKSHAVFASKFPVLEARIEWMRYCNRTDRPMLDGKQVDLPGLSTAHDGVAVAAGDSLEGLNGTGFAEADRALIDQDELRVFDMLTPNFTYYCEEVPVREGKPGEAAVFAFVKRKESLSGAEFHDRWNGAHAELVRAAIARQGAITRYVHNRPVHDPLPLFPFDGIVETWFAAPDDAVRSLTGDAMAPIRDDLAMFCDLAAGVTLLTAPCHRWPKD